MKKKNKKLDIKKAQILIDMLCKRYNFPKIPVVLIDSDSTYCIAQFDSEKYIIEVTKEANGRVLIHEFIHYGNCLYSHSYEFEETVTETAEVGFLKNIRQNNYDGFVKIKKLVNELGKAEI